MTEELAKQKVLADYPDAWMSETGHIWPYKLFTDEYKDSRPIGIGWEAAAKAKTCTCQHMKGHEGCRLACDIACGCVLHDDEYDFGEHPRADCEGCNHADCPCNAEDGQNAAESLPAAPEQEICGNSNHGWKARMKCVLPTGHTGNHEDSTRCWWR